MKIKEASDTSAAIGQLNNSIYEQFNVLKVIVILTNYNA